MKPVFPWSMSDFKPGEGILRCAERLYGVLRLPNGWSRSKTCDLQPLYAL